MNPDDPPPAVAASPAHAPGPLHMTPGQARALLAGGLRRGGLDADDAGAAADCQLHDLQAGHALDRPHPGQLTLQGEAVVLDLAPPAGDRPQRSFEQRA